MRILGIDPGSTATGFGVVDRAAGDLRHVAHGTLRPPRRAPLAERLAWLQRGLVHVIARHEPDLAVVERVFVAASPRSALVLGAARGVVLATLAGAGLALHEYAAREVKQAVVGTGAAEKRQVQLMVQRLLGLSRVPARDASDALAAAICHAHAGRLATLSVSSRLRRRRVGSARRLVVRGVR
jgi:crossover junction endodeoxyribonuclease RuvC